MSVAPPAPTPRLPSRLGEPVWEIADEYPPQGEWLEEDYLRRQFDRRVEFNDGFLEFLSMPTEVHQDVAGFLYRRLFDLLQDSGKVHFAGLRVRTRADRPRKHREPDVCFLSREKNDRRRERFWETADLVVEVVSEDDPDRDWVTKKAEYAAAGIPEYWIADPRDRTLTVFTLDDGATAYRQAGRYAEGETAASVLLDGLQIDVTACFDHE
ncbi:MAG: Uma2 family endonuclease [Planctomycetota bacterium]